MPLPFPLFVQRDLRRSHSACQQQPHPKGPSGCRHRSVVESILTQYMIGPMYWQLFQSNTKPAARPLQTRQLCGSLKNSLAAKCDLMARYSTAFGKFQQPRRHKRGRGSASPSQAPPHADRRRRTLCFPYPMCPSCPLLLALQLQPVSDHGDELRIGWLALGGIHLRSPARRPDR